MYLPAPNQRRLPQMTCDCGTGHQPDPPMPTGVHDAARPRRWNANQGSYRVSAMDELAGRIVPYFQLEPMSFVIGPGVCNMISLVSALE